MSKAKILTNPTPKEIKDIAKILKNGGVVIFPTDTLYGLGVDALNKKAINKIFKIKKRDIGKPISINISSKKNLKLLVVKIPNLAKKLIKEFWPGPLTIIFKKSNLIPSELTGGTQNIGIRIPNNQITLKLIKEFGGPITSTSVNISGTNNLISIDKIISDFSDKVDVIIVDKNLSSDQGSTIIDLSKDIPIIIREGVITSKAIDKIINKK